MGLLYFWNAREDAAERADARSPRAKT